MHKNFDKQCGSRRDFGAHNAHQSILEQAQANLQASLREDIEAEIQQYGLGGGIRRNNGPAAQNNDPCNHRQHHVYTLHAYGGCVHRIQWRLPAGSLQSLWLAWNIGDTVNNIPPVGAMNAPDVKHLDNLPNPNNEARRPSQKTMADICFVCTYIQSKVQEYGLWTEEMSH
jgi:hypothetical protein